MKYSIKFSAVMERLKKALECKKDKELADILGMSVNNYSNRKRTSALPWKEICLTCIEQNINIHWVLIGEGRPFTDSDELIAPVAEVDPRLLMEITAEIWKAFEGKENIPVLEAAATRGALAANIFNKVAFVKSEKIRSTMIHDQATQIAETAKWL